MRPPTERPRVRPAFTPEWRQRNDGVWAVTRYGHEARQRRVHGENSRFKDVYPPPFPDYKSMPDDQWQAFLKKLRARHPRFRMPSLFLLASTEDVGQARNWPTLPCRVECPTCRRVQTMDASLADNW